MAYITKSNLFVKTFEYFLLKCCFYFISYSITFRNELFIFVWSWNWMLYEEENSGWFPRSCLSVFLCCVLYLVAESCPTLCDPMDCNSPGSSVLELHESLSHTAAAAAKSLQSCLTLCGPIDGSPPRLPRPWDSPGKNTGVGCHFLLQCRKVKSESEVTQSCPTPSDPMDCGLPGSSIHGVFQARVLEWVAIAFSIIIASYYCFVLFFIIGRVSSKHKPNIA